MNFYSRKWDRPYLTPSLARALLAKSPAHARLGCPYFPEYTPRQPTVAMIEGTIVDEMLIGDHDRVVVVDAQDWRTRAAREQRDEATAAGKIPVLTQTADRCAMLAALLRRELERNEVDLASAALRRRLFWRSENVECSGEPDIVDHMCDPPMVIDIKTTTICPTVDNWTRHVAGMGYDIQAAAYCEAVGGGRFAWLVIETAPPYSVVMHVASGALLRVGQRQWDDAKQLWSQCLAGGDFPGPDDGIIDPAPWQTSDEITFTEEE